MSCCISVPASANLPTLPGQRLWRSLGQLDVHLSFAECTGVYIIDSRFGGGICSALTDSSLISCLCVVLMVSSPHPIWRRSLLTTTPVFHFQIPCQISRVILPVEGMQFNSLLISCSRPDCCFTLYHHPISVDFSCPFPQLGTAFPLYVMLEAGMH